ncbi:arylsulfatase precursor [Metarhizium rileyi]|uniref:Arylsulfatase n=1 Tax=Metarhizium rileyi (strain RCEF 4871) TaxID=1649241 RepID=A0A166Z033_METRR|nr:arylsulfatase precursor [Metarhizium rileyi RCEF 4871]
MTDDQDVHLNSLDFQPSVQKHFIQQGTWLQKHFCTVSLCCPSRVSLLTGQAAHNTNVTDVALPYVLIDPGTCVYNNASMVLDNGVWAFHPGAYSTDLVANRSVEFLGDAIEARKPFFLGVAPIAPHAETVGDAFEAPVPAKRHENLFPDVKVPRWPSFNARAAGAVSYFRNLPQLAHDQIDYMDTFYRRRLQSLQAVDDLIEAIMAKLESHADMLANTYLFYTSDNGYHIGQHRLPPGKTCGIEEDVNVPFIARGPGIPVGHVGRFPTSHTDLVPTIFELAGIPQREEFDGEPMPLKENRQGRTSTKSEHINIEFWGAGIVEGTAFENLSKDALDRYTYKTLRVDTEDYAFMYTVWCTNEHELYNMKLDPFQMNNLYGSNSTTSSFEISQLSARLDTLLLTLKACKGIVCRRPWQTLFPTGNVSSLMDAMDPSYDDFFLLSQPRVAFTMCSLGYIAEAEGPLSPVIFGAVDETTIEPRK